MLTKKILLALVLASPSFVAAQSSYLIPAMKEQILLERMQIKAKTNYLKYASIQPLLRRDAVADIELLDSLYYAQNKAVEGLTEIDKYNMQRFLMNNSEWSKPRESYKSEKPIFKTFYKTRGNAFEINNPDLFLAFNPVIQYQQYKETDNDKTVFLNSRGTAVRGVIGRKVAFSFYFTENQERTPLYVQQYVNRYNAPGTGFLKSFKGDAYDYFDTRASVSWRVASFMDMQLGYDRNFIGNGYRSLFLSDFSTSNMFLKVQTHFKRVHYQTIFSELTRRHSISGNKVTPRKYFRASYLNVRVTNWLNLGFFEGLILGKTDRLSLKLFNPIIYTNFQTDDANELRDRSYVGFDVKANLLKRVQLYGQLMIDKFKQNELSNDWWGNRFGYQAGLKYVDAFGLKNVDVQLETNRVRPYTYAAADTVTSYTHYNQPLAHPLGANFHEYIGIVRAQPMKKLYLQARLIHYIQGLDSTNYNAGSYLFNNFASRPKDVGLEVGHGNKATCTYASFVASYEVKENLFVDISATRRNYKTQLSGEANTTFFGIGFRLNMARREFDF